MKYFFPIHLDGGNRGCEGIAKGTASILGEPKENLISLSNDVELDKKLGLDELYTLQREREKSCVFNVVNKFYCGIAKLSNKDNYCRMSFYWKYKYGYFLDQMKPGDVMLSTGGDMMCYSNNEVIYTNDYLHERDVKTVLWGCSMGEDNCTKEKKRTLYNFDLVYTRESLTYDFFQSIGLKNVICCPDPAFILKPEPIVLPNIFKKGNVLGLNLSNYVLGGFSLDTPFGIQVKKLINYVLKETNIQILLIPHVTWKGQDDRIIASIVKNIYHETDRIDVLSINNLNYLQIRYVISKCSFFIGGRTHAVISAYSTCVPTIALGYSIKSRGIAKDLGISEHYVIDSHNSNLDVVEAFKKLVAEKGVVRHQLETIMPDYLRKLSRLKSDLKELF